MGWDLKSENVSRCHKTKVGQKIVLSILWTNKVYSREDSDAMIYCFTYKIGGLKFDAELDCFRKLKPTQPVHSSLWKSIDTNLGFATFLLGLECTNALIIQLIIYEHICSNGQILPNKNIAKPRLVSILFHRLE